jgi:hypothetical protein
MGRLYSIFSESPSQTQKDKGKYQKREHLPHQQRIGIHPASMILKPQEARQISGAANWRQEALIA